jgi:hypothetical protein
MGRQSSVACLGGIEGSLIGTSNGQLQHPGDAKHNTAQLFMLCDLVTNSVAVLSLCVRQYQPL